VTIFLKNPSFSLIPWRPLKTNVWIAIPLIALFKYKLISFQTLFLATEISKNENFD